MQADKQIAVVSVLYEEGETPNAFLAQFFEHLPNVRPRGFIIPMIILPNLRLRARVWVRVRRSHDHAAAMH